MDYHLFLTLKSGFKNQKSNFVGWQSDDHPNSRLFR
jgi:hypothetical protein